MEGIKKMMSTLRTLALAAGLAAGLSLVSYAQALDRKNAVESPGHEGPVPLSSPTGVDLTISFQGSGGGRVVGPSFDIECSDGCEKAIREAAGKTLVLQAVPAPGSVFSGWFGPADCQDGVVTLIGDLRCVARFEASEAAQEVEVFDYFEGSFTTGASYSNAFTEVSLSVIVTTPSGVTTVRGFYDGDGGGGQNGKVWKFRYMPVETGAHSFITNSNDNDLNGEGGAFTAVPSARKGPIAISPANPHLTTYKAGGAFVPVGETTFFVLSDDFTQASRLGYVSQAAGKGVNKIILVMVNDDTNDVYPWLGSPGSLDRLRFNLPRIAEWEDLIEAMRNAGIAAYLWFYSDDSARLYPAQNSAEEDLYFSYIISRFSAYENVIWNLGLEYSEYRTHQWVEARAAFVKSEDPYDHLVAVHQLSGQQFDFMGNPHLDIYSHQGDISSAAVPSSLVLNNQTQSAAAGHPIVVWPEEWVFQPSSSDYSHVLEVAWAITLQGGGHTIMGLNFWGSPGSLHWWNDLQAVMSQLMARVNRYDTMRERNDLVTGGGSSRLCMAESGREYLVMSLKKSTFQVNLSGNSGTLSVQWWNLDTGAVVDAGEVSGGSARDFSPPFTPAVLHLAPVALFTDDFESGGTSAWSP